MRTNLSQAFAQLRRDGYFARQNFMCCQSCGWSEIPETRRDKAVFYHAQDYRDYKYYREDVYLAWAGDGEFIINTLKNFGLDVDWDGDKGTRIMVKNNSII
jgi:hypothetical protein